MEPKTFIDVLLKTSQALTGVASVAIAIFLARLGVKQRQDAWFKAFNELHHAFWNDGAMATVREWIANDDAYGALDAALMKRLASRADVTAAEYKMLEVLDKFFNFLLRAREVASELESHRDLWGRIYFQFWFDEILLAKRHRLWAYYVRFYRANTEVLIPSLSAEAIAAFEQEVAAVQPSK